MIVPIMTILPKLLEFLQGVHLSRHVRRNVLEISVRNSASVTNRHLFNKDAGEEIDWGSQKVPLNSRPKTMNPPICWAMKAMASDIFDVDPS